MHSQLVVIPPKETINISGKIKELLYPFMEPKVEYFEEAYIDQLSSKHNLNEDNFYEIVNILEAEQNISPLEQVQYDEKKVYKIIDKNPNFVPDVGRLEDYGMD